MVDLPAAVVGHDDAVDRLERARRVVGVQDALEQDRQRRALAQASRGGPSDSAGFGVDVEEGLDGRPGLRRAQVVEEPARVVRAIDEQRPHRAEGDLDLLARPARGGDPFADDLAKRGSEVYCAMPSPRANGNDPRLRSCGRQPSIVVSSVTTSAFARRPRPVRSSSPPAARRSTSRAGTRTAWSPMARAVSSIGLQPCEEKTYGVPGGAAPRAMCTSLSGAISAPPRPGRAAAATARSVPGTVVGRSHVVVPCSIRGTIRQRSKASRLCRILAPEPPAPPPSSTPSRFTM